MSYIRLTSKCNMSCEHCSYNCTMEGEDMSLDTFRLALELDNYVTLGGGEPTLHPKFWEMFGLSIGTAESTYIITNGSMTEISLKLLKISQISKEMFGVELSQDDYHDPIDCKVVEAYTKARRIRNVFGTDNMISHTGRAKEFWEKDECNDNCVCDDLCIEPNGDIKFCGCDNAPIVGSVFTGIEDKYQEIRIDLNEYCWNKYVDSKKEEVTA